MDNIFELGLQIAKLDEKLLLLINGFHNEFFDSLMWTISGKWTWIPLYIILAYLIVRCGKWKCGLLCLLFIALTITFADQTCASYIRPFVQRPRPSALDSPIVGLVHIVNNYRGGHYGFPSCHAANTFALTTFIALYFRRRRIGMMMFAWASVVSYSRIYLGVHYPGDILAGMAVGCFYACLFYVMYRICLDLTMVKAKTKVRIRNINIYNALRPVAIFILLVKFSMCFGQTDSVAHSTDIVSDTVVAAINADTMKTSFGSVTDSIAPVRPVNSPYKFKPLQLIAPAALIGVGIFGLHNKWLIHQNKSLREELQENIDTRFTIDDFTQYAPMTAAYGLRLCGVKGKHGYGDMTIILGTAYALMGISVNSLKTITKVQRPDESSFNSFPSGHTATAFMGAELLRREYWDVSPWIGVAGYAVAAGTGFFRMYNNRHWLTDVIAGAGIGILSVEAAYWLYPFISKTFFRKRYLKNTFISPYYSKENKGVTCSITF